MNVRTGRPIFATLAIVTAMIIAAGCDSTSNNAPSTPVLNSFDSTGRVDSAVTFVFTSVDPENQDLSYMVDWGDGRTLEWSPRQTSGLPYIARHYYFAPGSFDVTCRAIDTDDRVSGWSSPQRVRVTGTAKPGRGGWWMFKRDAAHGGMSTQNGPMSARLRWKFNAVKAVRTSPAFFADGSLVFGSDNNVVYAVYPDGQLKWRYDVAVAAVRSSPAIFPDGSVCVATNGGMVIALDASGAFKWSASTTGPIDRSSPALSSSGAVVIGNLDREISCFSSVGARIWTYQANGSVASSAAISASGTAYIGSDDNILYAISSTGRLVWSYATAGAISSSPALGSDGTVYVGSGDNRLYTLWPDGAMKWRFDAHAIILSSPSIDADGAVFFTTAGGELYKLAKDGSLLWSVRFGQSGGGTSPVLDARGNVYVATPAGQLFAIDGSNGREIWRYTLGGTVSATPAIGPDGTVYIGCDDGYLYAFGT